MGNTVWSAHILKINPILVNRFRINFKLDRLFHKLQQFFWLFFYGLQLNFNLTWSLRVILSTRRTTLDNFWSKPCCGRVFMSSNQTYHTHNYTLSLFLWSSSTQSSACHAWPHAFSHWHTNKLVSYNTKLVSTNTECLILKTLEWPWRVLHRKLTCIQSFWVVINMNKDIFERNCWWGFGVL